MRWFVFAPKDYWLRKGNQSRMPNIKDAFLNRTGVHLYVYEDEEMVKVFNYEERFKERLDAIVAAHVYENLEIFLEQIALDVIQELGNPWNTG